MKNSLSKEEIIDKEKDFDKLFELEPIIFDGIKLRVMESFQRKAAFITPKSIGNSVVRNRLRRIVRELYRINKQKFPRDKAFLFQITSNSEESIRKSFQKILEYIDETYPHHSN